MPCSYYTEAESRENERDELDEVTRLLCSVMKLNPYYHGRDDKYYNILTCGFVDGLEEWVKDHTQRDNERRVSENYRHYAKLYPTLTKEQVIANVNAGVFDDISGDSEFYERIIAITKLPINE